jgi:hypothetical protein
MFRQTAISACATSASAWCKFLNSCFLPTFRKEPGAEIQTETLSPALLKLARSVKVRRATMMAFYS